MRAAKSPHPVHRSRSATLLAVLLVGLLALTGVGCGTKSTNATDAGASTPTATSTPAATATDSTATGGKAAPEKVRLAKTKFVLHAGLAFGAFHRYLYKPYTSGKFAAAGKGRKVLIAAKGALAALFAFREVKLALQAAHSSPLLSKLLSPLTALQTRLSSLGTRLRGGQVSTADITQANSEIASVGQQGAAAGAPIKDLTPPTSLQPTGY